MSTRFCAWWMPGTHWWRSRSRSEYGRWRGAALIWGQGDRGFCLGLPQSPPRLIQWWLLMPRVTRWGQEGRDLQKAELSPWPVPSNTACPRRGQSQAGDGAVPSVLGAIFCSRCRRKTRYQSAPRNIYRHIILSEIKEATAALPLVRGPEGLQRVPGSLQLLPPSLCHGICWRWPHGFTSFPSLSGGDLAAGDGL